MKRFSAILSVVLVLCLFALPLTASAADSYVTLQGFAFNINSDGKAVIHDYDRRSNAVVIPRTLLGAEVAVIDDNAFFGNADMTDVSFANATSLSTIGINAFCGCAGLTGLSIPSWIDELSFGSFQKCTSLETLVIEEGLTSIPDQCFYGCASLREVTIPDSVSEIGSYAFSGCTGLKELTLPGTVTSIEEGAFDNCPLLRIFGHEGTEAERYAAEAGVPFISLEAEPYHILGDTDGNLTVEIIDAVYIRRAAAQLDTPFTEAELLRGDADENGVIDLYDVTAIQYYLAHKDTPFRTGAVIS